MPYKLQSAGDGKYFVVDDNGKKYSEKPLPKWRASAQMRALWAKANPKKEKHLEGQHDQRAHGSWAKQGPYESKFDADKWNAMDFQGKRDAWNAQAPKEQDRQADPTKSIPAYQNELLKDAGTRPNLNKNDVHLSINKRLDQIGDLVPPTTTEEIRIITTGLDDLLSLAGVEAPFRHEIAMEAVDALAAQDYESAGRVLGDHGIAHIGGNINFASEILQQHPGEDDPGEMAAVVLAQVFHDTGYMAPPSRNFLDEQHPRWSTQHYDKNIRPLIAKALGDREASNIGHMISTHFETEIDWKNDLQGSAVRVADNLALFQKEKLPPLLRLVPDNIPILEALGQKKIDLKEAKTQMAANVAKSSFSDRFKESLGRAANELTPVTPKFVLGMLGGDVLRFQWAGDHLKVVLGRNATADRLQQILDLGQKQFAKFAKTYGINPDQFLKDLNFEFKNPTTGATLLEGEIAEEKSRRKGWHGRRRREKHLSGQHNQADHGVWAHANMAPDKGFGSGSGGMFGGSGGGGSGQQGGLFGGEKPRAVQGDIFGLTKTEPAPEENLSPRERWLRDQLRKSTTEQAEAFFSEQQPKKPKGQTSNTWQEWQVKKARQKVESINTEIRNLISDYKLEIEHNPNAGWGRLKKIYDQINKLSEERAPFIEQLEARDQLRMDLPGMKDVLKLQMVKSLKEFLAWDIVKKLFAPEGDSRKSSGLLAREKHLSGQHDQSAHGVWAHANMAPDKGFGGDPEQLSLFGLKPKRSREPITIPSGNPENAAPAILRGKFSETHQWLASPENPGAKAGTRKLNFFDEESEYKKLFDDKPGGQGATLKPGVTRAQAERYFKRRDTHIAAGRFKYKDGSTIKSMIEAALQEGYTKITKAKPMGLLMTNPKTGGYFQVKRKLETDYLEMLLNRGYFKEKELPAWREKHMPGKHPQDRHGWRYGRQSVSQARRISGQGSAEWQEYKKRARGRGELPADSASAMHELDNRARHLAKLKDPKERLHALADLQETQSKYQNERGEQYHALESLIAKEKIKAKRELHQQKQEGKGPGPTAYGGTTVAYGTDAHKIYEFKYRLMELDDMVTSNSPDGAINPDYDQALQPRIRTRQASEGQINKIAGDLNPDRLLTDFHQLDEGPMIVGPDNMVEAGNGRTLALDKARKAYPEQWDNYQQALKERLDDYGMSAEDLQGMKNPVLVRERVTEVPDRAKFAAETNQRTTLDMSPLEQALSDSKIINDKALANFTVEEDQTIDQALRSRNNTAFVQSFVGDLPENERAAILRGDGSLNRMGLWRIKAAVFSRVFPGEAGQRLADTFLESLDPSIKNFENAMSASLPQMAKAEWLLDSGQRKKNLSLSRDFAKAIDMLARLREQGIPVPDYLAQIQMFGKELNNTQLSLLKKFDAIARKPKTIKEFFRKYATLINSAPNPKQTTSSIFGNVDLSTDDLLNNLLSTNIEEAIPVGQAGLFAGVQ